jgi:hypothetical protein
MAENDSVDIMSIPVQLDIQMVHRILLCDPTDFSTLALNTKTPTRTFQNFMQTIMEGSDPASVMKRAYHDSFVQGASRNCQGFLERLKEFLLELHSSIRELVPNRLDLHSVLIDDRELPLEGDGRRTMSVILTWIMDAAQALVQLESIARSETTVAWIHIAKEKLQNATPTGLKDDQHLVINAESLNEESSSFLVASLMYLSFKAELCESDKNDFYLSHVVAPRIYSSGEGIEMERSLFRERYGSHLPHTQDWIYSLVMEAKAHSEAESDEMQRRLRENPKSRRDLLRMGWVEILFQKTKQTIIPEILMLDIPNLQSIRSITRLATAGCALGLHSCNAVKRSHNLLQTEDAMSKGKSLVQAMMKSQYNNSIITYEKGVEMAVLNLARGWKESPLDTSEEEFLQGRTRSVLRGDDPVIQLLDSRMKLAFSDVAMNSISEEAILAPAEMRSGRQSIQPTTTVGSKVSPMFTRARQLFCNRGLALYATELAKAAELSIKVIDLAWKLYGEDILDKMILEAYDAS